MTDEERSGTNSSPPGPDVSGNDQPSQIGPYRILDTLGEGGMSVVYLAEQSEPVRRRVALKILKPGMDSKQIVARFESERQALAVLDHPNIAKIFDGGIAESGRPYFVMEQVKGVPITDYCDDQRLNNEERLKVFVKICAAVQHAHLKGLIHRDLKPSNILVGVVDEEPQPKIIDFGIAKATTITLTEATLYTRVGQIIGTPQYMSPEQADVTGLDIDTRTDIYSLGVVLYELLVGTVPLDLRTIGAQSMQVAIREKQPSKPSTRFTELGDTREEVAKVRGTNPDRLQQQLKGDLDWIVMRAIEKDRTRRYETVNALAMDCRRFLKHEPVLARPPSPGYLLQRFVRRNHLTVIAGSVAILAIIAGAVVATLGYLRATEAEQVARQEAARAQQVSDFLVEVFEVSDPSEARGSSVTARELLERASERIAGALENDPESRIALMSTIATVYTNLGLYQEAIDLLDQSLKAQEIVDARGNLDAAQTLTDLATAYHHLGDYDRSISLHREALAIRERLAPDSAVVAYSLDNIGAGFYFQDELASAREYMLRALELRQKLSGEVNADIATSLNNVAALSSNLGDLETQIEYQQQAYDAFAELLGPTHQSTLIVLNNLLLGLREVGKNTEAGPLFDRLLEGTRSIHTPPHPDLANSYHNYALFLIQTGSPDEALEYLDEARLQWSKSIGPDHHRTLTAQANTGLALYHLDRLSEAEEVLVETLAAQELALSQHSTMAVTLSNLALVMYARQRYEEGIDFSRRAHQVAVLGWPQNAAKQELYHAYTARGLSFLGRREEAEAIYAEAYPIVLASYGSESFSVRQLKTWMDEL